MKRLSLLSGAFVLAVMVAPPLSAGHAGDGNRLLRGSYGYAFSGSFGAGLTNQIVETGVFTADGKGNLEATAKAVVNGALEEDATYVCTYEVGSGMAIEFDCDRTTDQGTVDALFFGVLDDHRQEMRFQARPSAAPFDIVNVTGSARKQ